MADKILRVEKVTKQFGGVVAANQVSFSMDPGEIIGLIGPNGAGKSTLFNMCSAVFPPTSGEIWFGNKRIDRLTPFEVATLGISRTFQNLQIFKNMTVLENVMVGRHVRTKSGFFSAAFRLPWAVSEEKRIREMSMEMLAFVGLAEWAGYNAGNLPLGKQRLLELARALATEPVLLLLDEIAAGLNHMETRQMRELIQKIRERDVSVLVVEHDMDLVMNISDRVIVLDQGEKIAEGTPAEVQNNLRVITAYLGGEIERESTNQSEEVPVSYEKAAVGNT